MKTCTKCGESKPLDEYHRNKTMKDGRLNVCRTCSSAYKRSRNAMPEVKARNAETRRAWVEANREHVRARQAEYDKQHYQENRVRKLAYAADYRAQPEVKKRTSERMREYRARPEVKARSSEYMRTYQAENMHLWWEHDYAIRAKRFGFEVVMESFTKADLIARWGDACFHCGGPFEELDHWPVPICRGGHHSLESTRPSCQQCNAKSWRQSV